MPRIWSDIDLNDAYPQYQPNSLKNKANQTRAYKFYYTFISPKTSGKKEHYIENANCLKFITKLKPFNKFYTGTVVNILKKCPNLIAINLSDFKGNIPYNAILNFCPKVNLIFINCCHAAPYYHVRWNINIFSKFTRHEIHPATKITSEFTRQILNLPVTDYGTLIHLLNDPLINKQLADKLGYKQCCDVGQRCRYED